MAKKQRRRSARTRRPARRPPTTLPTDGSNPPSGPLDLSMLREPLETIAKSFAVIALRLAPVRSTTTQDRALFLDGLGLNASEIAAVLRSTPRSIGELIARARRK